MADPTPVADPEFWQAVLDANGGRPVPLEEVPDRIRDVLIDRQEWIQLEGVDNYALYSGNATGDPGNYISTEKMALDFAERSGGEVGIINNTRTGQALGGVFDDLYGAGSPADFMEQYSQYIDFGDHTIDLSDRTTTAPIVDFFNKASEQFALNASGNVVTITPHADMGRVYATEEVPGIVRGLVEGRIDQVNGQTADQLGELLEPFRDADGNFRAPGGDEGARAFEAITEQFNVQFDANMRAGDVGLYAEGRTVRTGLDAERLSQLGFDPDIRMDAPDLAGLTRQTVIAPEAPRGAGVDTTPEATASPEATTPETTNTPDSPRTVDTPSSSQGVLDSAQDGIDATRPAGASAADLADANSQALFDTDAIRRLGEASEAGQVRAFTADPDGNTAYLLDRSTGTMMEIQEGRIVGSRTFDSVQDANLAFGAKLNEAGMRFPDAFDGMPRVSGSLGEFAEHMDDLRAPGWMRNVAGAADEAGSFLGRASKVLGPLGVAAAGYEVYTLESQLVDYSEMGLVSAEAVWAYRGVLTAHAAQATVDPTLVGGELVVQEAYDQWVEHYEIPPTVAKALEPGSLVEDVAELGGWLSERAEEAGVAIEEYASSRWDDPSLMVEDFRRVGRLGEQIIGNAYERGVELADELSDYAGTRWDDPSLLIDDAAAAAQTTWNGLSAAGSWVWRNTFGGEESDPTNAVLGEEPTLRVEITLEDAARQFVLDREAVREAGGDTSAMDDPDVGELFDAADEAGVETITVDISESMTNAQRAAAIARSVETAREAAVEAATQDAQRTTEQAVPEPELEYDAGM